jgi:outer membrane receptor protein involved in Fe transport
MTLNIYGNKPLLKKMLLIMKLTTLLLFVFCINIYAKTNAQITIREKNASLEKVLKQIKKQSGYDLFFDENLVKQKSIPVDVDIRNSSVESALAQVFASQPLVFEIVGKIISIKEKTVAPQKEPIAIKEETPAIPPVTVHGTVKDGNGNPVEAASVAIKGTLKGTSTDANGRFTLEANKGDILVISSLNYNLKYVKVESETVVVELQLNIKPLDEVIIGGNYVPTKRKAEVSSVTVISSETLEKLPFQDVEQIFRGLVPGTNSLQATDFEVSQPTYFSGAVSIRGSGGFGGVGVVKVLVDGIEVSGGSYWLNTIDKNNIDHIEVVKGPSAATLYGSGANGGLIMIYTKKGNANRTSVDLSSSAGWLDSKWEHKKKFQQVHSFNMMQGFKNISYSVGGNLNNSESYMPGGKTNKYAFNGNVTYSKNPKFKISLDGRHFVNNYKPNRNAFYDDSTAAYYNRVGYKKPDTTHGAIVTNTIGLNANFQAAGWWSHNVVAGWSDNAFSRETDLTNPPLKGQNSSNKGVTLRYNNTITMAAKSDFKTTLLTGVDYTSNKSDAVYQLNGNSVTRQNTKWENTGVFGQLNPSYKNKYFLTLALRADINRDFSTTYSPKIGATTNFQVGQVTLKPRISWGKGITPPAPGQRYPDPSPYPGLVYLANPGLKPQKQTGWDFGLEGYMGRQLKFEVVYYDNIMTDAFYSLTTNAPNGDLEFQTVNAGKVTNRGWEFSADYNLKGFTANANYSITNSVLRTPLSGTASPKDAVQPGEQLQFIPKYTGGLTVGYYFPKLFGKGDGLSVSVAGTYASGIYSMDQAKFVYEVSVLRNPANLFSQGLRYFSTKNPDITKFNFNLEYNVLQQLKFFAQIRNIGNVTTGEYLNNSPSVGRSWLFGFKYNFSKVNL